MRPRVNTQKHYAQHSLFTVAAGAISNRVIANALAAPAASNQVREGAIISAVYIEMWIQTDDAALGSSIVTLEKVPAGQTLMAAGQSAALDTYPNKKNIFFTHMGLTSNNVTYPMSPIKGWFKIPKGKQRFGLNDQLVLNVHGQSNGLNACGFFIYKEQF